MSLDYLNLLNKCTYVVDDRDIQIDASERQNKFHVMHLNVRSYFKNCDKLILLLDELESRNVIIDVILLCETFINDVNVKLVGIPGYQCVTKNRVDKVGGGIAIFVKDNLKILDTIETIFDDVCESHFVSIQAYDKVFCVGELYRIPNTNLKLFQINYKKILDKVGKFKNLIIGSDHNLDLIRSNKHLPTLKFVENLSLQGLIATISRPTRVTHHSSTLIDNIFCGGQSIMDCESFVLQEHISDHSPCVLRLDKFFKHQNGDQIIVKRKLSDGKLLHLNQLLLFHDWMQMLRHDANLGYDYLIAVITKYLDEVAPKREILVTQKELFREPWMSIKFCKWNTKCQKLYKRSIKNPALYEKI